MDGFNLLIGMNEVGASKEPQYHLSLQKRRSSHYFGIRQQTKQAHLGYPAERNGSIRLRGEPITRRQMVNVALSGERDPHVDIRQGDNHPSVVRPHPCQ